MSDMQSSEGGPWDAVPQPEPPTQPYPYAQPQDADFGAAPYGSVPGPGGYPGAVGFGQPYGQPAYGMPGYGPVGSNGMSIAALVCGICGFLCGVPAILGIIFGCVGLSQINRTSQSGKGMAIAGIICGALWIALFIVLIATGHSTYSSSSDNSDF